MSRAAVDAYREERGATLDVLKSLSAEEWELPTGCEGWNVKDLVLHLGTSLQIVVDPENAMPPGDDGTEASLDAAVAAARDMPVAEVLAMYEDLSGKATEAFAGLQADGIAETEIPMADLGTHPMHLIANAFAFDTYTHLRIDLSAPRGAIERDLPPASEAALAASVEWLLAGLPQMGTQALKPTITAPLGLRLTGPGGGEWTLRPSDGDHACEVVPGVADDAVATIESSVADFVSWSTTRSDWRDQVTITGDAKQAGTTLDAINLI